MLRVVDKDTLIIRRDILRTICDLLFINPALKDDFRECGGFASILSALTSLSGCKLLAPPPRWRANQIWLDMKYLGFKEKDPTVVDQAIVFLEGLFQALALGLYGHHQNKTFFHEHKGKIYSLLLLACDDNDFL